MGALYKEMGVNPLAGCLPLLVQMPFLIAIFYALQGYPYDQNYVQFLWLPSLMNQIQCTSWVSMRHPHGLRPSKLVAVHLGAASNNKRL